MKFRLKTGEMDLTTGNLFPKLVQFALPLVLSGILQCLYNAADIIVIGQCAGSAPMAAVGATSTLISMITNLFVGFSVGTGITVAVAVGARDKERSYRLVHTSIALALLSGIIVMIAGLIFARDFLQLLGTPDDIIDMSTSYLRIYFAGSIFSMLYNFAAAVIRSYGDSQSPTLYLIISGAVNVVLNLFFVLVVGWDVEGVATATIVSQFISAFLAVRLLIRKSDLYRFAVREVRFYKKETLDIIRTGLPAGLQGIIFSLSNLMVQSAVNSFDTAAIAGNTAASSLDGIIYTAMYAISTTAVTAVGQNVGAGKTERLHKILWQCLLLVTAIGFAVGGVIVLFGRPLLGIYISDSPEAIEFGMIRLMFLATTYYMCGWMDTLVGVSRGMGNTLVPMLVSVVGVCGVRFLWIGTVFNTYHTLETLYILYPVSWLVTAAVQLALCLVIMKKTIRRIAESRDPAQVLPV